MNFRQLQCAVCLSEIGSFSKASEKLGITQPALSKHILSLEKDLGVQLFDRSQAHPGLTAAGEHFIREAKELLYKEDMLCRSMEQFRSGDKGELTIGITPFRSSYLIADIVKKVREKFPGIKIRLIEEGSEKLRKDASDGKFDFAVVNMPVDEALMDVILLEPDRLSLVLSPSLYEKYEELREKKEIEFSDLGNIPFAVPGENQEMRRLFDKLCAASGVYPEIACEAVNLTTVRELAVAGVGAVLLPVQFIGEHINSGKLKVIELKNNVYLRQPAVVYKKGQYISKYARYAVELLTKKEKTQ